MRRYSFRVVSLLVLGMTILAAFAVWLAAEPARRGRALAEEDWRSTRQVVFVNEALPRFTRGPSYYVEVNYDFETGLELYHMPRSREPAFYKAYNSRMRELIQESGGPRCRAVTRLLHPEDLIDTLDSIGFAEISTFPHEINENIVVCSAGDFSRWGYTSYSATDPRIETRLGGSIGLRPAEAIYVGRIEQQPRIVVIRSGKKVFEILDEEGRFLGTLVKIKDKPERLGTSAGSEGGNIGVERTD